MSKGWSYSSGQWYVLCDVCSKKIKSSDAKHRWDGLIVCPDDHENRHPQDFLRAKMDKISVPFTRPQSTDTFVAINYIVSYVDDGYTDTGYLEELT